MLINDHSDPYAFHLEGKLLLKLMYNAKEIILWMTLKTELQTMCVISKHLNHKRWQISKWQSFIFSYFLGKIKGENVALLQITGKKGNFLLFPCISLHYLAHFQVWVKVFKNYIIYFRITLHLFDPDIF